MRDHSNRTVPAAQTHVAVEKGRDAALAVAQNAIDVFSQGRWAKTPMAQQAYALAVHVLTLESQLGPVDDAGFVEDHVAMMAQLAHQIMQHARHDRLHGGALLSRTADWQLLDAQVEKRLLRAYSLVAS